MEEKVIKSMLKEGKPVSIHTVVDNLHEQELIVLGLIIKMLKKRLIRQMPSIPLSESPEPCSNFYVLTKKGITMLNHEENNSTIEIRVL